MIVCICKAVNERAIRRAVADGIETFDELQFELGVGTCCGKCAATAREILCTARTAVCGSPGESPVDSMRRPMHVERRETAHA